MLPTTDTFAYIRVLVENPQYKIPVTSAKGLSMGALIPVGLILKLFVTKCAIKSVGSSHMRSGLQLGDALLLSLLASALERAVHLSVCLSDWKSV
jgi:hypothetical protein